VEAGEAHDFSWTLPGHADTGIQDLPTTHSMRDCLIQSWICRMAHWTAL
jgi:hypothetical protein